MKGTLEAIHIAAAAGAPMQALREVTLITDTGVAGDRKAKPGSKRQVLVIPIEVLEAFDLQPGMIRENLTLRGVDVFALAAGQQVRVGTALLELTKYCTPCEFMDSVRPGLRAAMHDRRGMLFRVVQGGVIRVGDAVEVLQRS
ncbi:MAG: MOSC domain-containing protein [Anaerolineae bacterium]